MSDAALQEELADLQQALGRKRNEIGNLKVGYIRAVQGASIIPAEPLRRNLIAARSDLIELEQRIAALRKLLGKDQLADPSP